jgi:hypothetical protein
MVEEIAFNTGWGTKFTALEVPRQCPLVLLVNVSWRESRALGSEEDKVSGSGVLAYAAEGRI